jgi:hypothetical protein
MVDELGSGLEALLDQHGLESVQDVRGHSLSYPTTCSHLVDLLADSRGQTAAANAAFRDRQWGELDLMQGADLLTSE